jgi:hypothetical protein
MTRKIKIMGYRPKADKLVPDYKHLSVNLRLQKRASKRVRGAKPTASPARQQARAGR